MAFQKHVPPSDTPSMNMRPLSCYGKANEKAQPAELQNSVSEKDIDLDLREVYFLIMHFLSAGPCQRASGQLWNELLEHQLLPRRYHAWYSRSGAHTGDENDNGMSLPLNYEMLVQRYSFIERDHLVKLLKQLVLSASLPGGNAFNAAAVPTILGTGSFSLLNSDQNKMKSEVTYPPRCMRWPHMLADQVRGLNLREIGGGFSRHHRAPSSRAACYAIAKPSTMVQKLQNNRTVRGHRHAVYCAIFDRSGRFVVTGSDDRLVKIWSMETAYCLASCRGHEGDITDLAVNFNNTLVASSSNDCIIRVWRLPDGLPISVLRGHTGAVTAIAFSPRPSAVYQLLSSSDDGTCRIWDARYSQFSPRIYVPKPSDSGAGRSNGPSSSTAQQSHQIFCCAFNASGTVFVTGSSDTLARVWNAFKPSTDDIQQPIHEMDVLAGHENDVNYVQFSGCTVASRFSGPDTSKEESIPKFKNTWYNHENIVTCSRDGSAIIWVPRSRRSHGKIGRWVRAYHLKVPPPPMPPQPPRGGPRQRILPTPRGVNMIVWSLDNRFVLAAIMDCRICVWNAADGSLVHSLTGHTESTYVLDVHPFNPRIAMSAGYDGKMIVWDIWEGIPIRTYKIGPFKLVDGKFSPDGTSIILSDDVGQLYILTTGEGELQKDAKYDQFFLGDYRPLIQDTHGNVLDRETQLAPYRRNMQDLLCDSGMIPYPEPYQSMYQRRRLGALGIEWHPTSVRFAVGADISLDQEYQMLPIADLDMLIEPLPEFADAMDWEPEIEIQSDDTDSEYNVTEEYSSGREQGVLSSHSSDEFESTGEDSGAEHSHEDGPRRSNRKKKKAEIMTSSGRRVKRKNLDAYDGSSLGNNHNRKSRIGQKSSIKKSSSSKSLRPQRAAARHALNLFSRITGTSKDGQEEYNSVGDSSESESTEQDSNVAGEDSDVSTQIERREHSKGKELYTEQSADLDKSHEHPETHTNAGSTRRLVLKLSKPPRSTLFKFEDQHGPSGSSAVASHYEANKDYTKDQGYSQVDAIGDNVGRSKTIQSGKVEHHLDLLEGCKDGKISWGGVKARTSKRVKVADPSSSGAGPGSSLNPDGNVGTENFSHGHPGAEKEGETLPPSSVIQNQGTEMRESIQMGDTANIISNLEGADNHEPHSNSNQCTYPEESPANTHKLIDGMAEPFGVRINGTEHYPLEENSKPIPIKLMVKSRGGQSPSKVEAESSLDGSSHNLCDTLSEIPDTGKNLNSDVSTYEVSERSDLGTASHDRLQELDNSVGTTSTGALQDAKLFHSPRMFTAVYRRSKSLRGRNNAVGDTRIMEPSTSTANNRNQNKAADTTTESVRRPRSIRLRSSTCDPSVAGSSLRRSESGIGSENPSSAIKNPSRNKDSGILSEEQRLLSRAAVGVRSTRNRRASHYVRETSPPDRRKSNHSTRSSWLMLTAHEEEGSRYIPQRGDEVVYLRQGHQEYITGSKSKDVGPWKTIKGNIRAVEYCRVTDLEYSTLSGSGDGCCKMTLQFVDPTSEVTGKTFRSTLPELANFPDFLVLRSRYDAAMERNWTHRDKCQVWWKTEDEEDGSWWEGRIVAVMPKSADFPDSPWDRYLVQYKSDPREKHQHSPWELYDADMHFEPPHVDDEITDKLLTALIKLEESGNKPQDHYGVRKLKEVSQKISFINRFPVPLSLEVIQSRLENNYYRSLEAIEHDIEVLVTNAESYFSRSAEVLTKMRRLSDWFSRTLKSL